MKRARSIFWTSLIWSFLIGLATGLAEAQVVASVDVVAGPVTSGPVISGWAFDPAAPVDGISSVDLHGWHLRPDGSIDAYLPLGPASLGVARPEVGARFGFAATQSGFARQVLGLGPGPWLVQIIVTPRTGTPVNAFVRVTVANTLRQWIDLPSAGAPVSGVVYLVGWSLDSSNAAGPGISSVDICAIQVAAPELGCHSVAVAQLGQYRPDLGAAFGAQHAGAGWFAITTPLPPGDYDLAVTATAGSRSITSILRVRVR